GGAYQPILKRIDEFLTAKLSKALEIRRERARQLLALDEAVNAAVAALKAHGFQSPYLKAFVVKDQLPALQEGQGGIRRNDRQAHRRGAEVRCGEDQARPDHGERWRAGRVKTFSVHGCRFSVTEDHEPTTDD